MYERQKTLQESQERLLEGQALLNQREEYILSRSQELNRLEKEYESSKADIDKELRGLNEKRSNLELTVASLSAREEVYTITFFFIYVCINENDNCEHRELDCCFVSQRAIHAIIPEFSQAVIKRECELSKREEDLLILQERLISKESVSLFLHSGHLITCK